MDFEKIKAAAQAYQADMTRFLRDMISHPSESCEEREVVHCIKAETPGIIRTTASAITAAANSPPVKT